MRSRPGWNIPSQRRGAVSWNRWTAFPNGERPIWKNADALPLLPGVRGDEIGCTGSQSSACSKDACSEMISKIRLPRPEFVSDPAGRTFSDGAAHHTALWCLQVMGRFFQSAHSKPHLSLPDGHFSVSIFLYADS